LALSPMRKLGAEARPRVPRTSPSPLPHPLPHPQASRARARRQPGPVAAGAGGVHAEGVAPSSGALPPGRRSCRRGASALPLPRFRPLGLARAGKAVAWTPRLAMRLERRSHAEGLPRRRVPCRRFWPTQPGCLGVTKGAVPRPAARRHMGAFRSRQCGPHPAHPPHVPREGWGAGDAGHAGDGCGRSRRRRGRCCHRPVEPRSWLAASSRTPPAVQGGSPDSSGVPFSIAGAATAVRRAAEPTCPALLSLTLSRTSPSPPGLARAREAAARTRGRRRRGASTPKGCLTGECLAAAPGRRSCRQAASALPLPHPRPRAREGGSPGASA
jgi:hypothetical protein